MSFIGTKHEGTTYAPGYFLAHEECKRETRTIPQSLATTTDEGAQYVKAGTIFPSNDENAVGIIYEDVDVSTGNMPGSVVTDGFVFKDRLPVAPVADAITAMKGIKFEDETAVERPY